MNLVENVYNLRRKFLILGLTGRTGSGCTTVADLLSGGFDKISSTPNFNCEKMTNDDRKYLIEYRFLKTIWKKKDFKFNVIKASDIIFFYAIKENFDDFCNSLFNLDDGKKLSNQVQKNNELYKLKNEYDKNSNIVKNIDKYLESLEYEVYSHKSNGIDMDVNDIKNHLTFIAEELPKIRNNVMMASGKTKGEITTLFQTWGDNIRKYGRITDKGDEVEDPSQLAHTINRIILLIHKKNKIEGKPTFVIIDSLRSPYEVLYFRERYSSFYLMSINTKESNRKRNLHEAKFGDDDIKNLDDREYPSQSPKGIKGYNSQDVERCVELSDIHIVHNNDQVEQNVILKRQILHIIALILRPGLVPPTPEERLMQIANTAKVNSGCVSRQVGAVITDEDYSVKAIGWNTVPKGQTPCSLRNLCDLMERKDLSAFSEFEKSDDSFRVIVEGCWKAYCGVGNNKNISRCLEKLDGTPLVYCFKDLYTRKEGNKNQVHTRSLHAEENAFLQLAKYGSMGIKGGYLFTTASCCELCAKKAYQLGISKIYYIDIYPGITNSHILNVGKHKIEIIQFRGIVGRAYEALYNPFFPMKDEIRFLTDVKIDRENPVFFTVSKYSQNGANFQRQLNTPTSSMDDSSNENVKLGKCKFKLWLINKLKTLFKSNNFL